MFELKTPSSKKIKDKNKGSFKIWPLFKRGHEAKIKKNTKKTIPKLRLEGNLRLFIIKYIIFNLRFWKVLNLYTLRLLYNNFHLPYLKFWIINYLKNLKSY